MKCSFTVRDQALELFGEGRSNGVVVSPDRQVGLIWLPVLAQVVTDGALCRTMILIVLMRLLVIRKLHFTSSSVAIAGIVEGKLGFCVCILYRRVWDRYRPCRSQRVRNFR